MPQLFGVGLEEGAGCGVWRLASSGTPVTINLLRCPSRLRVCLAISDTQVSRPSNILLILTERLKQKWLRQLWIANEACASH